jgi:anti-sigma factor RsiW
VEETIMTARDVDGWLPYIDAYVDGTLEDKDALRLTVAAEQSAELRTAIEGARGFHAALSAMPVESPAPGFDSRVLESVPLSRYASAPRRRPLFVALGEWAPSPVQRFMERLGSALSAVAAAWVLALALGSTAWQAQVSSAGAWIGSQLQAWSLAAEGTAIVGPVARTLSGAYDASLGALGSLAGTLGLGLTIFLLGAAVGVALLFFAIRRRSIVRDGGAHHA